MPNYSISMSTKVCILLTIACMLWSTVDATINFTLEPNCVDNDCLPSGQQLKNLLSQPRRLHIASKSYISMDYSNTTGKKVNPGQDIASVFCKSELQYMIGRRTVIEKSAGGTGIKSKCKFNSNLNTLDSCRMLRRKLKAKKFTSEQATILGKMRWKVMFPWANNETLLTVVEASGNYSSWSVTSTKPVLSTSEVELVLKKVKELGFDPAESLDVKRICRQWKKHGRVQRDIIGAVYFMSNDPRGNAVIATSIQKSGRLGFSRSFGTGGTGGYIVSARSITGDADSLESQHPIIINRDTLFMVNAGSNTVSLFVIDRSNPVSLRLVTTFDSGGEFPVALAFSQKLRLLCVLNGGAINTIQCFSVVRNNTLKQPTVVRLPQLVKSLGLKLTTPPSHALTSVSDIVFTPDSSQLLVSVHGNEHIGQPSSITSFHIEHALIGNAVRNQLPGLMIPYGMEFVAGRRQEPLLVFADPGANGFGLARVKGTGVIEKSHITTIPDQMATCWTALSSRSGHLFTTDTYADLVTESELDLDTLAAKIVKQYPIPGNPLDEVMVSLKNEDVLYVLTPGLPGIHVLSLAVPGGAQVIQRYTPKRAGLYYALNSAAAGLAAYLVK